MAFLLLLRRWAGRLAGALVFCLAPFGALQAQGIEQSFSSAQRFDPVKFDAEPQDSIGGFTRLANRIFKPKGEGPFPAVVLMHTCGGIDNPHMRDHGRSLLAAGYVVVLVDSFNPRGVANCSRGPMSVAAGIADAYAALALLAAQPYVNKDRIYQAGYSWGAIVAMLLSSPQSAAVGKSSSRFRATVSNYSSCALKQYRFVLDDVDKPLLVLMGEKDDELPMAPCFPLLDQLKAGGKPVEWHVFTGATHGWDKTGQRDRGYVYDADVTRQATERMLGFFDRNK